MLIRQIRVIDSLDGKIAWKKKEIPTPLLWSWLDTHVQAIAHPSRGMKLTQPRQQRYACAAPKTFVVPFSFQSSFTQQASFFSPGPCFHFTANTIWFGFHDIPAQRRSHSAGTPAWRRSRRIPYAESKRRHATAAPRQCEHTHHPK